MEQEQTVEIPMSEYFCAIDRWVLYWEDCHTYQPHELFYHFLGSRNGDRPVLGANHTKAGNTMTVTQSAARKIQLLNSPHYYAILRAYRVVHKLGGTDG